MQAIRLTPTKSCAGKPKPPKYPTSLLLLSLICLTSFRPTLSVFSTKTHYSVGGDIILIDILPNGNILRVTENYILTTFSATTYTQLSSVTLTLDADGSQICDAVIIDQNNILIVTYLKVWTVNLQTLVEKKHGTGLVSNKQRQPKK